MGVGEYTFKTLDSVEMHALHHYMGKPVGTDCGVRTLKRLVLFTAHGLSNLSAFLNKLVTMMETSDDDKFTCYTWKIRHQYWDEESKVLKRPIDSVVLPRVVKDRMVNDLSKFLLPKTKDFYMRNGIPYRRSYLFYGTPGTGKTSMVQALAAHFGRNVCFLLPTHPDMNDDTLRAAVNSIPENSIVVFEDIDSLFAKDRSSQMSKNSVSFSGLLNALDGIGAANGQVFVLTTNLRENLDNALIRNGRVDLHFEFTYAVAEQMEMMWSNFYPDAKDLAATFSAAVEASLTEHDLKVTTAGLQHFFVTQMEATAEEALAHVGEIVEGISLNSSKDMLEAAAAKEAKDVAKQRRREKRENKGKNPASGGGLQSFESPINAAILAAVSATPTPAAPALATPAAVDDEAAKREENRKRKTQKRNDRRRQIRTSKAEAKKGAEGDGDETSVPSEASNSVLASVPAMIVETK